jgi:putative spermidine/putrescine transport system ATP-binding protein
MQTKNRAAELDARGIGKTYGDFHALDDVSLTIGRGEFLTLLGPSGSGKTTFLMILAGFVNATSGALTKDGADITHLPAEKRAFGMVFQGYALFPHMSVEKNIAFPLQVQGRNAQDIKKKVDNIVDRVGLREHATKRPADLSGGQQQRVALARALVFEPSVLLLDEPFSALDKNLRGSMQEEVRRLHQETGTTFVFVTHDQSEALALASRIAIFNHGELLQVGTPQEVYDRPANRFTAEFLGEINMLPLKNVRQENGATTALCEDRAITVRGASGNAGGVTGDAVLAVRPEYMTVRSEAAPDENGIAATTTASTYLGAATKLDLETKQGTKLSVSVPNEIAADALRSGNSVWLTWPAERGILLVR